MIRRILNLIILICTVGFVNNLIAQNQLEKPKISNQYNVVWNTPSPDAWESMPLSGRFGAGANVWVQEGSVWLYLAHNLAYDEDGRLLKLGALRITPSNKAFTNLSSFKQELDLASGAIFINASSKNGESIKIKLWFAGENLIIESATKNKTALEISFGSWREITRDSMFIDMGKRVTTLRADSISMNKQGVLWFHQNAKYPSVLQSELNIQPFAVNNLYNPTEGNLFGGAIVSSQPIKPMGKKPVEWQRWKGASWTMMVEPAAKHTIVAALRAGQAISPEKWIQEAKAFLDEKSLKSYANEEIKWWNEFWNRSYITINNEAASSDSAWIVGRNYQLFRYMLACNRNGKLPLLFNGGIFTTDNFDKIKGNNNDEIQRKLLGPSTPDLRHWLFCSFMAQNQRWLGWPTILAGDADLLEASNAFYRNHAVSAAARAKGLGAEGVVYPEPIKIWGLTWWPLPTGQCGAQHLKYAFAMMLENAWMALHGYATLGKDISADMEWIKGTVKFYNSFYRNETKRLTGKELGDDGKLSIYPANSIELLVGAKNPIEVVAGLRRICDALTKLPDNLVSTTEKKYFQNIYQVLPDLPVGERNGKPILLPAKEWEKEYNLWELPELYSAWPYRLQTVTRPGTTQIAKNTWDLLPQNRSQKVTRDFSWMPVVVNMAAIGNTDEAAKRIVDKLGNFNPQARFPAFFGPGHDWVPDHNWGGSGMVGLQEMLMAADPYGDGKIYLLPAWPTNWDVDFKLHAPENTIVEASVRKGKIVSLKVTPEHRRKDIIVNNQFSISSN
jgi:hypothetical protein